MRDAKTVLGIIRERGKEGLPIEDVYRQLFNPDLYLLAYGKISRNQGAMTPGVTKETVDEMNLDKIQGIIGMLRKETYQWKPARRTYIEKKNSTKKRPLGIPTWSDKLLQEVIRLILEAYYEPQFSDHSHGFRPERGCHTALREIYQVWKGTVWFIEGDIKGCFDNIDHSILLSILREKIHDGRFIRLIENLLKAGYLEEWKYNKTWSGTPQGGIVSPVLANIYLNRLDQFIEKTLIPANTHGERRSHNPAYKTVNDRSNYLHRTGQKEEARKLKKIAQSLPSRDPNDPDYRRLRYVRYADDFLLGVIGTRQEAEEIKQQLRGFLKDELRLELSEEKTLITHGRTEAARFLGYEIVVMHNDQKHTNNQRSVNAVIGFKVPMEVIREKSLPYMENGKPKARPEMLRDTDFQIVTHFQLVYRGIVNYYRMAYNLRTLSLLKWNLERSMIYTLARKYKITSPKVWKKYQCSIETDDGPRKGLEVKVEREGKDPLITRWGGISLKWQIAGTTLNDQQPTGIINTHAGSDLLTRLLADECELCGSQENVEVHHIRRLKDLKKPGQSEKPEWAKKMASRHRKTLVVCHECHVGEKGIHPGRYDGKNLRK